MAAYTSTKSGNWSDSTVWGGTPTSADTCTIANTHTVTLDTTGLVCSALTINSGGTLAASTTASSTLTVQLGITNNGTLTQDMSAASSYTSTILMNESNNATAQGCTHGAAASFTHKGATKKSWTTITSAISVGATSCVVADATGWLVNDVLIFATTDAYASPPHTDQITVGTITPGSGTTATITWTGGTTYSHAISCPVANMTRNAVIGTSNSAYKSFVYSSNQSGSPTRVIRDAVFSNMASGHTTFPSLALKLVSAQTALAGVYNCVFLNNGVDSGVYQGSTAMDWSNCVSYSSGNAFSSSQTFSSWNATGNLVLRAAIGMTSANPSESPSGNYISGCTTSALYIPRESQNWRSCEIWGCSAAVLGNSTIPTYGRIAASNIGIISTCGTAFNAAGGPFKVDAEDCNFQASNLFTTSSNDFTQLTLKNKNGDSGVQEVYTRHSSTVPAIQRNVATVTRSTSSIEMTMNYTGAVIQQFTVLTKAGETITLLTYVRKSSSPAYGASTLPSVTVSGLGITPVVSTMSAGTAADTWELLTTNATNSGSADGLLTVTLTAQSATAGAKAFFSGIPCAPFITRARHYGYLFNETNPAVTVDGLKSADFATADAYTDFTFSWGATSSVALAASSTFQKLFDSHQAKAVQNVGSALALTGAGVAGSPSLFAAGNITTTGYTLNGAGSLSMGTKTLTASLPWAYTYTGGTFSQSSTVPAFAGGTLNIGAAGTYTFTASSAIVSMTPTAPGTYVMGGCTFSGTIDLRNAAAHAITVEVPSGTTTTTTNNTGGAITVSTPQIYQTVTITGPVAGSRIQIYDTTHSTELYNGTPTFPYTWTDGSPAASDRDIRIRVAYVNGATAKIFIEASIGTCGTTSPSNAVSYLVNQTNDTTYNSNAINGPSIYATSGITFTDAATDLVNCNIGGGSVTYPTIYACFVYWNFTATGIANDFTYVDAPDTANYLFSGMKIRNTSATDLTVTGGYGRDATSGLSKDIVDTAGSTGNIFLAPDHVVAYATGSGSLTAGDISNIWAAGTRTLTTTIPTAAQISTQVLTDAQSTPIHSDLRKVANATVTGSGTANDPWGPA